MLRKEEMMKGYERNVGRDEGLQRRTRQIPPRKAGHDTRRSEAVSFSYLSVTPSQHNAPNFWWEISRSLTSVS